MKGLNLDYAEEDIILSVNIESIHSMFMGNNGPLVELPGGDFQTKVRHPFCRYDAQIDRV